MLCAADYIETGGEESSAHGNHMKNGNQDMNWLAAFRKGDVHVFKDVYLRHYRSLYIFTAGILKNDPEQAEDIVQETFRKLWEVKERLTDVNHIRNFLFFVTRNACFNSLRHTNVQFSVHKDLVSLSPLEERSAEAARIHAEVIDEIYKQIDALPENYGRVIRMLYLQEMKPVEVAQKLGISTNAVLIQKTRALKLLRLSLPDKSLLVLMIFSWYFL
jgi:RNA polymerase sigma-70 factor (ECF subfamily)